MSTFIEKPLSLIERKKLQWAKEKEELAGLCAPWGATNKDSQIVEKSFQRNRNVSKLAMTNNELFRKDANRRSSLPPLSRNQFNSSEIGGETSGYGSDQANNCGYESSSSFKDDRPKWKENKNFWNVNENDPPNWVKRGLQRDEEIIVSNTSPAESPQQDEEIERPNSGCSSNTSNLHRSFIRGQNLPLDSTELAERERRRQIALAHQEAIRQQLEEREKRRQEEKQKRIKEEQEEELRIEREQEIERKRKESELEAIRRKQERERKKQEAIKEALELAEKEAKLEKLKQKIKKQENETTCKQIHNNLEKEKNNNNEEQSAVSSPRQDIINNNLNNERALTPKNNEKMETSKSFQILTPRNEIAFVVQTQDVLQNLPYAVLVPNLNQTNSTIAIPIVETPKEIFSARTENRILTPTQYRNKNKILCDASTQTDDLNNKAELETCSNNHKYIREKLTNLELNYDNRKERRSRSVGEKPKWGANRPPTRYMKQSEKDPFYHQRRKQRQQLRRDYKNSSDESQMASPRSYRRRQTRALWRKNDHFLTRNIRMYQTEIVPLESDKEQIYYPPRCECCCRCRCEAKSEILKIQQQSPRLPDCNDNLENASYIFDKLSCLHNGLVLKQEHWERSPRTPSLSSSK